VRTLAFLTILLDDEELLAAKRSASHKTTPASQTGKQPSQPPVIPPSGKPDPTPLLLASERDPRDVRGILSAYGVTDIDQADRNLQSMAGEPHERRHLAAILPVLMDSLARTADPDQALNHWERLLETVTRSTFLDYLRSSPRMLDLLSTIFGNSDSLAFTIIRDPMLVYWLAEEEVLSKPSTKAGLERALEMQLARLTVKELKLVVLRRFRRREMLRIGVRDLLKLADVAETTASLSDLAALLIHAAYEIVDADLRRQYGRPMHKSRQGTWVETGFAVIGMGKLGGHELNYSSDVDLIYVYASHEGETRAAAGGSTKPTAAGISNEEYFEILSRELTKALSEPTREGYVFRVDLRLRAEGSVGQLARSLDDYRKYYATRGQIWERLALLKAWPIAGSATVGKAFLKIVRPFTLGGGEAKPGPMAVIEEVRAVKEMIDARMAGRGHEHRNVKLGTGGIREIEFLVQTIQVLAGKASPALVDRSTLGSLKAFADEHLLSVKERDALSAAYSFLRDVEHKLQMVHDLQTHSLPDQAEELAHCAIRMGYGTEDRAGGVAQFMADRQSHTELVNRTFRAFFQEHKTSTLLKKVLRALHVRR
jgi:[glutamine synthetase] adenylyltransferase / [glutamine synthetase]-adenylyl-L-tyrosine phosphorylase